MEYPSDLGETGVSGAVYPFFSGDFYSTFTWTGGGSEASVSGNVEVEVQPSDWMMQKDKGLTLKNPTVEIYVDGNAYRSIRCRQKWQIRLLHATPIRLRRRLR